MIQVVNFEGETYIVTREQGEIKRIETIYNGQLYPCEFGDKDMVKFCNVANVTNAPTKRMPKRMLSLV